MTRQTLVLAAALASQSGAVPDAERAMRSRFEDFVNTHRVREYGAWEYSSGEELLSRYEIFKANVQKIDEVNSLNLSYTLAVNEFTDLTAEEFSKSHGFMTESPLRAMKSLGVDQYLEGFMAPDSVDWVSKGAVTAVKNQQQCGSCWSFSTTGGLEGAYQIATGRLVSMSEQQLVDCDTADSGCSGGLMKQALEYEQAHDICTEDSYRYTARGGSCKASGCTVAIPQGGVTGIRSVGASESALMGAVAGRPISIAVDAGPWQSYQGGVLSDCNHNSLDHGVLLVGYGSNYWKVKNSWGTGWGESGYIRMQKGSGVNCCGLINSDAVYPVVSSSPGPSPGPSPSPSPTPSPSPDCKDEWPFCSQDLCFFFKSHCRKTCGACDGFEDVQV